MDFENEGREKMQTDPTYLHKLTDQYSTYSILSYLILIADGTQIFICRLYFLKFKLSFLSVILQTRSVLHAFIGFRRQICKRCLILYMQRNAAII